MPGQTASADGTVVAELVTVNYCYESVKHECIAGMADVMGC